MSWFRSFRSEHGFTSYPDLQTPVTIDKPLLAVTYFCVVVAIATVIATLGIRGREKWSSFLRASYAVTIGSIILVSIYGHCWQQGEITITSPYVYRSSMPFEGRVGIHVALHGTNVTLEGFYRGAAGDGYVHFVESLPWADYGHEPECFAEFLHRGLPDPILKVMEFLTVDEGGLRWGRSFHHAGHYGAVLLWSAFAFWVISNVLLFSVVVYGAYMFTFTGLAMVAACVAYHSCLNAQPLVITFSEVELTVKYGWCFWLTLVSGGVTFALGLTLILMDQFWHDAVAQFFNLEKMDDDELYENFKELNKTVPRLSSGMDAPEVRKGSIFLDPVRMPSTLNSNDIRRGSQPNWYSENLRRTSLSTPNFLTGKMNPVYIEEERPEQTQSDDVMINMEQVCQEEVPQSVKNPSSATPKENRDNYSNHANERLTCPCQPTSSDEDTQYTSTSGGEFSLREQLTRDITSGVSIPLAPSITTRSSPVGEPQSVYMSGVKSDDETLIGKDSCIVCVSPDISHDTHHGITKINKNILDARRAQLQREHSMGFIPAVQNVSKVSLEEDSGISVFSDSENEAKPYHVTEIKIGSNSSSTISSLDTGTATTGDQILLREGRQIPRLFRLPGNGNSSAGSPDLSFSTRSNCIERLRSV